jgi:hypothetical protein
MIRELEELSLGEVTIPGSCRTCSHCGVATLQSKAMGRIFRPTRLLLDAKTKDFFVGQVFVGSQSCLLTTPAPARLFFEDVPDSRREEGIFFGGGRFTYATVAIGIVLSVRLENPGEHPIVVRAKFLGRFVEVLP